MLGFVKVVSCHHGCFLFVYGWGGEGSAGKIVGRGTQLVGEGKEKWEHTLFAICRGHSVGGRQQEEVGEGVW